MKAEIEFGFGINDIPVTCHGPDGGNIHEPNEWGDLPSVKRVTETYANFISDWSQAKKI